MEAYHNDPAIKDAIIAQVRAHQEADQIVQGHGYWKDGRGCGVGCTIHSGDHAEYEPRFGIPQALARLEDTIFENLPQADAREWPVRFLSAPRPGADLSLVQWQFLAFVVEEALSRPEAVSVRAACQPALDVVRARARGEQVSTSAAWSAVRSAAWSAAASAESAARSAAWSAARSAVSAAWSAVRSAESAARSAVWSAASAAASAAWSAESAAWRRYADKLIELMAAAPVLVEA